MIIRRLEIWIVNLDPTVGHEVQKTRPCVVVSPDEMNRHSETIITVPLTTKSRPYPTRVPVKVRGVPNQMMIDHIRACDRSRFIRRVGKLDPATAARLLRVIRELFAE